jgi:hypothetical protein
MVFERFGQSITLVLEKLVELWLLFLIYNYIIEVKEWCFRNIPIVISRLVIMNVHVKPDLPSGLPPAL